MSRRRPAVKQATQLALQLLGAAALGALFSDFVSIFFAVLRVRRVRRALAFSKVSQPRFQTCYAAAFPVGSQLRSQPSSYLRRRLSSYAVVPQSLRSCSLSSRLPKNALQPLTSEGSELVCFRARRSSIMRKSIQCHYELLRKICSQLCSKFVQLAAQRTVKAATPAMQREADESRKERKSTGQAFRSLVRKNPTGTIPQQAICTLYIVQRALARRGDSADRRRRSAWGIG